MEYRQLGRAGVRVSELCLGTMTFGNEADESTSKQIVDRFMDAGGNFVDTANVYSQGVSAAWPCRPGNVNPARPETEQR